MSGATSSRWCATWSRSRSPWSRKKSVKRCARPPWGTPRTGCSSCWCRRGRPRPFASSLVKPSPEDEEEDELSVTREKFRDKLRSGALDHRRVEIEVDEASYPSLEMFTPQGVEEVGINIKDMLPGLFGRKRKQTVSVAEAREILQQQEAEKLIDRALVAREARQRVEQGGMIFLDEIDKIAGREGGRGPDISREGVQRDLLPIVEGTNVSTKYG